MYKHTYIYVYGDEMTFFLRWTRSGCLGRSQMLSCLWSGWCLRLLRERMAVCSRFYALSAVIWSALIRSENPAIDRRFPLPDSENMSRQDVYEDKMKSLCRLNLHITSSQKGRAFIEDLSLILWDVLSKLSVIFRA